MIGLIYFQNPNPMKGPGGKNLEKVEIQNQRGSQNG
jgi:hypothetical protein